MTVFVTHGLNFRLDGKAFRANVGDTLVITRYSTVQFLVGDKFLIASDTKIRMERTGKDYYYSRNDLKLGSEVVLYNVKVSKEDLL